MKFVFVKESKKGVGEMHFTWKEIWILIRHKKFNWEGWMWHPEREKKFNSNSKKRLFKIFN